jgi:hypothetical protein
MRFFSVPHFVVEAKYIAKFFVRKLGGARAAIRLLAVISTGTK